MGVQTEGITSKPSESSCEDARVAALRCECIFSFPFCSSNRESPRSQKERVTNTRTLSRFQRHETIHARAHAGSTKYPNQRIVCKELYETYKACRKKEQEEIVKERKRKKVSIL
jgi:RNA:NAD 2'-phosphotransferase (TPT1/KptA family)